MLEYIESLIPDGYRQNFYRNLFTLEIDYGIELVDLGENKNNDLKTWGGYSITKNKIIIYKHTLDDKRAYSNTTDNPEEVYNREINLIFIHELLHMASSFFDSENHIMLCGFDDKCDLIHHVGLTEGFTEALAMNAIRGTNELASGYYIEALISIQLGLIVEFDTLLKSYFGTLGIKDIKDKLNLIEDNPAFSDGLLNNIEYSYNVRNTLGDTEQTFLGSVQNLMVYYLEQKIIKAIEERTMSKNDIMDLLKNFEQALITPQILVANHLNPNNYKRIDRSLDAFKNTKEYIYSILEESIKVI